MYLTRIAIRIAPYFPVRGQQGDDEGEHIGEARLAAGRGGLQLEDVSRRRDPPDRNNQRGVFAAAWRLCRASNKGTIAIRIAHAPNYCGDDDMNVMTMQSDTDTHVLSRLSDLDRSFDIAIWIAHLT